MRPFSQQLAPLGVGENRELIKITLTTYLREAFFENFCAENWEVVLTSGQKHCEVLSAVGWGEN
jgi:hypothetical protein